MHGLPSKQEFLTRYVRNMVWADLSISDMSKHCRVVEQDHGEMLMSSLGNPHSVYAFEQTQQATMILP
jgi:hypothetical protein